MQTAGHKPEPLLPCVLTSAGSATDLQKARWLIFLILAVCFARVVYAVDAPRAPSQTTNSYAVAIKKYLAQVATNSVRLPDPRAEALKFAEVESELSSRVQELAQPPQVNVPPPPTSHNAVILTVAVLLGAILVIRQFVALLNGQFNSWATARTGSGVNILAEDQSFLDFKKSFRAGPEKPSAESSGDAKSLSAEVPVETSQDKSIKEVTFLNEFFAAAAKDFAIFRTFLSEIRRAPEQAGRQKLLIGLLGQIDSFKRKSGLPELLPIWQVTLALEGLLNQLSRKSTNVTASALLTACGAVDLLEALCIPNLKLDLVSNPPVRLLVVDDDLLSRNALSVALKKGLNQPDLANDATAALAFAAKESYDVIFLDVEMPGMDGFELCATIHDTIPNKNTPVVFVTSHSDFDARAKSRDAGGNDLIAKPFLAFEITVKAITLVLKARLQSIATENPSHIKEVPEPIAVKKAASNKSAAPAEPTQSPRPGPIGSDLKEQASKILEKQREREGQTTTAGTPHPGVPAPAHCSASISPTPPKLSSEPSDAALPNSLTPSNKDFAEAFFNNAPAGLEQLRNHLNAARNASGSAELQEILGLLYISVHTLVSDVQHAELSALFKLLSALEGMLKKLLEQPRFCGPSTLEAAGAAIDLIEELCRTRSNPELVNPPARIMVVDDDPIARRAISVSLQLTFGKPESAASGEAAVALAAQTSFDLVFLDIRMPGMDGFAACSKIHEAAPNSLTPVVFVTSHDDKDTRSQAASSGGSGFIPKPILSSQITLVALTFILRSRMAKKGAAVESCSLAASP